MSGHDAPILIFDTGVGGLTVARSIIDQLPDEDVIYVGDTANGPYGPLSIPEVRAHALAIGDDLVSRGVKALVIACNTASAACLRDARERYDVPVVEVILPAVRRAVATTRTGRIGVIGTTATIASRAYQDAFAAARDVEPVYYERYMIGYNNKSPEVQRAAQDYIHDFFAKTPAERRAWSEELATNIYADPLAFQWPNHAKLFFNNKGVAANTTDICANYPADDMSLWTW